MNYWQGALYGKARQRVLILGESWYGDDESLTNYIQKWCNKGETDRTFSRLYKIIEKGDAYTASCDQRKAFWSKYAFYNFVPGTVGRDRTFRPTKKHYESAIVPFNRVLDKLKPDAVWILGIGQSEHSKPIVEQRDLIVNVAKHPAAVGVRNTYLRGKWLELLKGINAKV